VCPDDSIGMPVGDIGGDARHGEHGHGGGQADSAVDAVRRGRGRVITPNGQPSALNPPQTALASSSGSSAVAIEQRSGPGETGAGHRLLLRDRLGGIWEVASGANRPEPVLTELKQSL
jgi:hypothetical protein